MNVVPLKKSDDWVQQVLELVAEGESSFWKAAVLMQRQIDEEGMSQREVGRALGKSQGWVWTHLKWLKDSDTATKSLTSNASQTPKERTPFTGRKVAAKQRQSKPKTSPPSENMPTAAEAEESWQNDLYTQGCLLLEQMADATRQKFFAFFKRKYLP